MTAEKGLYKDEDFIA